MRKALAAVRLQLREARRTPTVYMSLLTTPAQAAVFLSIVESIDRPEFLAHALVAPALIAMWAVAVWTGGSVVRNDRFFGTLELHAAAPTPYSVPVIARLAAVMIVGMAAIPLTLATAWIGFGVTVEVRHPWILLATVLATVAAIAATALILTSLTVLSRAAVTFQNSASYPFLLLGGAFVPLSLLPGWVQPLGRIVFLSYSSDLVRDSITEQTVDLFWWRLAAVITLGAAGYLVGRWLLAKVMHRVRVTGEISAQ